MQDQPTLILASKNQVVLYLIVFLVLGFTQAAQGQGSAPELVVDIAASVGESSGAVMLGVEGSTGFFVASDGTHGNELWFTDGTGAGTGLLSDINPGAATGAFTPTLFGGVAHAVVGTKLIFRADDGLHGRELWMTDGTELGTSMIADICPGSCDSDPERFLVALGTLFFVAEDSDGDELWKTDLTELGTVQVKDIWPGSTGSFPRDLVEVGGKVYFRAQDDVSGGELWSSDGTELGTTMVEDLLPGTNHSSPSQLIAAGSNVIFSATVTDGKELFKYDTLTATAEQVADIHPTGSSDPRDFFAHSGKVYFSADDGVYGRELWVSDGTAFGTERLTDLNPDMGHANPGGFAPFGPDLLFVASSGTSNAALYKHNPLVPETTLVKDFETANLLGKAGGVTFLSANAGTDGLELWTTDGTTLGTIQVEDIKPGPDSSTPSHAAVLGTKLLFTASGPEGIELWISDGTGPGTDLVADVRTGTVGSILTSCDDSTGDDPLCGRFDNRVQLGDLLLFDAYTPEDGPEVWVTDGTSEGTTRLTDAPDSTGSHPIYFAASNGLAFFSASDGSGDRELWRSDGTAEGTFVVKNINTGDSSDPGDLIDGNGFLFFLADHPDYGEELWRSDGTEEGTFMVKDVRTGTATSYIDDLVMFNGSLVFAAETAETGREPWISDGTLEGTHLLADIDPTFDARSGMRGTEPNSSNPHSFVEFAGALYFRASDQASGGELFMTDGTAEGTGLAVDFCSGSCSSDATPKLVFEQELFILHEYSDPNDRGSEILRLAKIDALGSPSEVVNDVCGGGIECAEEPELVANDTAIFFSYRRDALSELWVSDGTAAGTEQLIDLNATGSSFPRGLSPFGRQLFFSADDGTDGRELWVSDGTAPGTALVADLSAGPRSSDPSDLVPVDNRGYFSADVLATGREPWKLDGVCQSHLDLGSRPLPGQTVKSATKTVTSRALLMAGDDAVLQAEHGVLLGSGFRVLAGASLSTSSDPVCP